MYYDGRGGEPRNHHSLPHGRAFFVLFFVRKERRGLVAELVDEDLELEDGALFGAAVFVLDEGFEEKRVGVDGPVERMGLGVREKREKKTRMRVM